MLFSVISTLMNGGHVDFWTVAAQVLSVIFVIFCILPLHEFAHGWVAYKLGDPTAKAAGRLTLNPLASIDPMGAIALVLLGFGWAKPVPVNPNYFKNPKRGMALTAAAGPLSNLLAALTGAFFWVGIIVFAPDGRTASFFHEVLSYYILVNITLAVFNLIPVPPLDGSRIVGAFLSDRALSAFYRYQNVYMLLLLVLMARGSFTGVRNAVEGFFADVILAIAKFPFELAGVL